MSLKGYYDDLARYTAKRIENLEARSIRETAQERLRNDLRDHLSEMAALFNLEQA